MFHISKIVWTLLQPSSFTAFVLLAGAIFTSTGHRRSGSRLLISGAALYLIFGFSPLPNWLLIPLELRAAASAQKDIESAAGIIVLGGAVLKPSKIGNGETQLNEAAERMTGAVKLAGLYPNMPLIFSGGKTDFIENDEEESESELARRFFQAFGIAPPRLRLEDHSRNTLENAVFTAKLLRPQPGDKWVLLTSAFHMSRATALFEAQGFQVLPWPVDFRTSGWSDSWNFFPRASDGFRRMDLAAKEWVGILVSWMRGDMSRPTGDLNKASR